jgi:hypothetical protein
LVAVRVTVYVPGVVYICDGFWRVDEPPSPNVHVHAAGELLDASTNWTASGTGPEVIFDVNAANGGAGSAVTGKRRNTIAMRMNHTAAVFMLSRPKNPFFWTHYKKKSAYLHPFVK